jgi:hypothetical protein
MYSLLDIVGLKVVAIRGWNPTPKREPKFVVVEYILFDDNKTYIDLESQDYHTYHDCSTDAKEITVYCDEVRYTQIINDLKHYPEATKNF